MNQVIARGKKFILKRFLIARVNRSYIGKSAQATALKAMHENFLLVSLAFNDLELIRIQQASLRRVNDAYDHIIADNSSDSDQSRAIELFCIEKGIGYIRLPQPNPGSILDRSLSHGFALNWIFYNVIMKIRPERFGFLESDVFVVERGSFLTPWEEKDFWGMKAPSMSDGRLWRLWPGFCFFRREFYESRRLNFLPIKNIDTGGGNFQFFKDIDTSYLIPLVLDSLIPATDVRIQRFANVIHLGEMSARTVDRQAIITRMTFANDMVFGNHE